MALSRKEEFKFFLFVKIYLIFILRFIDFKKSANVLILVHTSSHRIPIPLRKNVQVTVEILKNLFYKISINLRIDIDSYATQYLQPISRKVEIRTYKSYRKKTNKYMKAINKLRSLLSFIRVMV
jgi:hypothetical protein